MNDKLEKLMMMKAKSQRPMSELEKDAKMKAVGEMRKMASDEMAGPLKAGLKKVSVMSDSEQGVKSGLDKAKEMMEGSPKEEMVESPDEEASEMLGDDDENSDSEHLGQSMHGDHLDPMQEMPMSEDEIDQKMMELMQLKEKLKSSKM